MKILVTGANGFVGKDLRATLEQNDSYELFFVTRKTTEDELTEFAQQADFVFHFAGVNRTENES